MRACPCPRAARAAGPAGAWAGAGHRCVRVGGTRDRFETDRQDRKWPRVEGTRTLSAWPGVLGHWVSLNPRRKSRCSPRWRSWGGVWPGRTGLLPGGAGADAPECWAPDGPGVPGMWREVASRMARRSWQRQLPAPGVRCIPPLRDCPRAAGHGVTPLPWPLWTRHALQGPPSRPVLGRRLGGRSRVGCVPRHPRFGHQQCSPGGALGLTFPGPWASQGGRGSGTGEAGAAACTGAGCPPGWPLAWETHVGTSGPLAGTRRYPVQQGWTAGRCGADAAVEGGGRRGLHPQAGPSLWPAPLAGASRPHTACPKG